MPSYTSKTNKRQSKTKLPSPPSARIFPFRTRTHERKIYDPTILNTLDTMEIATHYLGDRLTCKRDGNYLDGRIVTLTQIMREVNRILALKGMAQVVNNPEWGV